MKTKNQTPTPDSRELERDVNQWINKNFNFVRLGVYEKVMEGNLPDYLVAPEVNNYDFLDECGLFNEYLKYCDNNKLDSDNLDSLDTFCELDENSDKLEGYRDSLNQANYPMSNTIFESRGITELSYAVTKYIESDSTLGMIEETEYFNESFFVKGCGFDFMDGFWIPMYKEVMGID